jgi:putative glycosyltransferase (TIGR04348 family)
MRNLGHHVNVITHYEGQSTDVFIALHAWRSANAVKQFKTQHPNTPIIVAITGTDAYRFIHSHPKETIGSIETADYLVGLHDLIANVLPNNQKHKMHVIKQSAASIAKRNPYKRYFHVAVMGHLREEKDPMRPALAVRNLPATSKIHVHHYGKAHSPEWAKIADQEMLINSHYTWHGEIVHHKIRQIYQRSNCLVLPSRMEGGANVISEAVVAGLPIIASDIEGSIGLLGEDYQAYYPVENEQALQNLLLRMETDINFYQTIEQSCLQKQMLFTPEREQKAWQELLLKII